MTLKSKTISGFKWSIIDTALRYFLAFFIGIILARILSPSDYGLVGMSAIFIAISRVFIDGGFSDALIRKTNCTVDDYSSILIFNIVLAFLLYLILFLTSNLISDFFNEPQLVDIIRVTGLGLIIGASSSIHSIYLKKILDFKLLAQIGFIGTIVSGLVSVIMAYWGYAFWSIIISGLIQGIVTSILLWLKRTNLELKFKFKFKIIVEHFSFGSKIMFGSLIHVIYNNMYYALVGKIFNTAVLGYYTRADNFQKLFSDNIDTVVRQVTYPVLSQIQGDENKLKSTYKTMLRTTSFLSFILLMGLVVVAKSFIVTLIGVKWLPSVPYLQLLCFVGIFLPLISINSNILNVKGRSDLTLKIVTLKVLLSIPSLVLGYYLGIYAMIIGILISLLITYFIVIIFSNQVIKYSLKEQFLDILPAVKLVLLALSPIYFIEPFLNFSSFVVLSIQSMLSLILIIFWSEILKNTEYFLIKNIIKSVIFKTK
ncbi:MAG: lipopolysaccharide biosynthesis protein [Bacteroidia bacterium]